MAVTRRDFLKWSAVAGAAVATWKPALSLDLLEPAVGVENPLAFYPSRGWEKVYRDQYRYDSSFAWVCSPNCT